MRNFMLPAGFQHGIHDLGRLLIILPAELAGCGKGAGKSHCQFLDVKHIERGVSETRLLHCEGEHRVETARGDQNGMGLRNSGTKPWNGFRGKRSRDLLADRQRSQTGPLLRIGPQPETQTDDADGKKERIGLGLGNGDFDGKHDQERQSQ